MLELRPSKQRGYADHGWLQSFHSFSFAGYYDPAHMGFGPLRVINEDWIAPGMGFGTHGHRDMEIITYVLEGRLAHKDSMGHVETISPHEVQRMSAGKGVMHSEFNHEENAKTHLLQIWIEPDVIGISPSYEQTYFSPESKRGCLKLVAAPDGRDGAVTIHANSFLYAGLFNGMESARYTLDKNRMAYVHVARGMVCINGQNLIAGDALKISDETVVSIAEGQDAEILLFDLPKV
mgnify:CR=1 FL=1